MLNAKTNKIQRLILPIIGLLLATMACKATSGLPLNQPVETPTPAPTIDIEQLQEDISESAVSQDEDGTITITLTEDQISDLLIYQLQQSSTDSFTNTKVTLQDNQIKVSGTLNQGVLTADANIVIELNTDNEGNLQVEIVSADFGPIPVPSSVLDNLSSMIEEGFNSEIGSDRSSFQIDQITIDNGTIIITGKSGSSQ